MHKNHQCMRKGQFSQKNMLSINLTQHAYTRGVMSQLNIIATQLIATQHVDRPSNTCAMIKWNPIIPSKAKHHIKQPHLIVTTYFPNMLIH